ncbi:MAG: DoxX family protein [Polaribacter sp.]
METNSFKKIDNSLINTMQRYSKPALRISLAIIFIWFGLLKPLGLSPAEGLLKQTVSWLPFGKPDIWLIIIGYWEVVIGILFLFKKTVRIAIALLFSQMIGTFMPLIFLPEITFQNNNPLLLTLEGQYIIKNILIISAALVLGGDLYKRKSN